MEVIARSTYIRQTARKLRFVAEAIRGMKAKEAVELLKNVNKSAAAPLLLTLEQGISNATHNFELDKSKLLIKKIEIGDGPIYKRGQPISRGRWHPVMKRTSHLQIVLTGEKTEKKEVKNGTKS